MREYQRHVGERNQNGGDVFLWRLDRFTTYNDSSTRFVLGEGLRLLPFRLQYLQYNSICYITWYINMYII